MSIEAAEPQRYRRNAHRFTFGDCPLCGREGIRLVTDHCHEHGWIRGRICESCNQALKVFDKRPILPWKWSVPPKFIAHALKCPDCNPGLWAVMIQNSAQMVGNHRKYEYL